MPVTWRRLSSDSVKRNRQSTRDYACECTTVQETPASTLAVYLKPFSLVALLKEARSTGKPIPRVLKSCSVDWLVHHTRAQKEGVCPFLTHILAVTLISYFLEPLPFLMLSQLLRKHY